jgi:hypothetical protein
MKTIKYFLTIISVLVILSSIVRAQSLQKNSVLFDAMSPYEDLTEYAINNSAAEVESTIRSISKLDNKLKNILTINTLNYLDNNKKKMQSAMMSGDYPVLALYAIESYKALAEELDVSKLNVPKEVVLLDYVGSKIQVLLKQNKIDWNSISEVTTQSSKLWNKIKNKISDNGLQDLMNTTMHGINNSANSRDTEMLKFAAQVDLDVIDLCERYFEKKTK